MVEFRKYRKHNKVFELPLPVRAELDQRLMDTSITYTDISRWLAEEEGIVISKSTIGRYALETKKLASRLIETQTRVRELIKVAKHHQDDEALTEGALQIATGKLSEKIALLEDEIDEMEPERAIKLMIDIARTKAYKDKVYTDIKGEFDQAYEKFKEQIRADFFDVLGKDHPELLDRMMQIADEAKNGIKGKV